LSPMRGSTMKRRANGCCPMVAKVVIRAHDDESGGK
jgi:hypothetical protein